MRKRWNDRAILRGKLVPPVGIGPTTPGLGIMQKT